MVSCIPESIPSLAELSQHSPETHPTSRTLFHMPQFGLKWEDMISDLYLSPSMEEDSDEDPFFGSDSPLEFAVQESTLRIKQFDTKWDQDLVNERPQSNSPKQHSSLFSMFDSDPSPFWPSHHPITSCRPSFREDEKMQHDTFDLGPKVPVQSAEAWKPRAESLQRECAALKEIMRVDSVKILKLRQEFATLDDLARHRLIEIDELNTELRKTKQRLDPLLRERAFQQEHELEYIETIRILKEEVDRLTRLKNESEDIEHTHVANGVTQLRYENALFASQIVENVAEMKQMRSTLEKTEADNKELLSHLEALENKMCAMESVRAQVFEPFQGDGAPFLFSESIESDLINEVESLTAKLDVMEGERRVMAVRYEEELFRKQQEIQEVASMVDRAKQKHEEQMKEKQARQGLSQVASMDEEIGRLAEIMQEKDAEIEDLRERIRVLPVCVDPSSPAPVTKRSLGPCDPFSLFSRCLLSK